MIRNCLLQKDLQIWIATFFHKVYIFLFDSKNYYYKYKIQFFNQNMWNTEKTYKNYILFIILIIVKKYYG